MAKNDFFLDPDESQTMGDINYMRMAKKVRRTFPKTLKNPKGFAIEKSVSSEGERDFSDANNGFQAKSISNDFQPQSTFDSTSNTESTSAPSKVDSSMDMFRNMAKNIRKRR